MKKMGTYGLVHLDHFGLHLVLWSTSSLGQLLLDSCVGLVPLHLGGHIKADGRDQSTLRLDANHHHPHLSHDVPP